MESVYGVFDGSVCVPNKNIFSKNQRVLITALDSSVQSSEEDEERLIKERNELVGKVSFDSFGDPLEFQRKMRCGYSCDVSDEDDSLRGAINDVRNGNNLYGPFHTVKDAMESMLGD